MTEGRETQGDRNNDGSRDQKVKVGEKEYTADDVQGLLSQVKGATENNQRLSLVENFCNKYDLDVEGLLDNAEGAFSVMTDLIDKGVIDKTGNVIKKKEKETDEGSGDGELDDLEKILTGKGDSKNLTGEAKIAAIVMKAIAPLSEKVNSFGETVSKTKDLQFSLMEERMIEKITKKFPVLSESRAKDVISLAAKDSRRSIMQVAELVAEKENENRAGLRKSYAEEFGINLEEFDAKKKRNELGDQGPGGGGVLPEFKGKKFSFKRKGEDYVTPLDAANAYFREVEKQR